MVAGAVGTLAMTVSEKVEMAVTGRPPSEIPGQVGAHLIPGTDSRSPGEVARLNSAVHWTHGIIMGALRGALDVAGLRGSQANLAHFALLWGGDAGLYRALGIAQAPWRWSASELATDLFHKGVYAGVTAVTYDALTSRT